MGEVPSESAAELRSSAQGKAGMLDLALVITVDCSSIRSTFSSWKLASGG